MALTLPGGVQSMQSTGTTNRDLYPSVNVYGAIKQVLGGGDQDILPSSTFSGGVREPVANTWHAPQTPGQYTVNGQSTAVAPTGTSTGPLAIPNAYGEPNIAQAPPTYTDPATGRTWSSYGEYSSNQANLRRNAGVKQGGYISGAETANETNRNQYNNDSQDFITGQRNSQNTINTNRVNNALNLRRSMAGIASGLRQGMRSGAVNLANMNALDSGASEAMARAFARQGNSQAADVNNQSQLVENSLGSEQANLEAARTQGLNRLKAWRDTEVKKVGNQLWQALSELDADMQGQGLGGAVDMGARDRIVSAANAALDAIDATTTAELGKFGALDQGQVLQQAAQMDAAGALASNPFSVGSGRMQWGQSPNTPAGAPLGPVTPGPIRRDEEMAPYVPFSALRNQDEAIA